MIRTELREHIFKLLFQEEFNREEDMQEHLKYYFMTLENAADKDKDYIQRNISCTDINAHEYST